MPNKKILLILFMGIFLFSFISASISYDNPTYEIDSWIPTWLGGNGYSNVTLLSNTDYCLTDCEATIKFINEEPVNLLEDISFLDRNGNDVQDNIKDLTFLIGKYEDVEKTKNIYEEVCETISGNQTNSSLENCYQNKTGEETYFENELVWKEYSGSEEEGEILLKIQAKKDISKSIDWIITFRGKELTEWAWWDSDWSRKKSINFNKTGNPTNADFQVKVNVTYEANMNSDFSDLRFTNLAEDTELEYYIEDKVDSIWAEIWVRLPTNITITDTILAYMYYGNALASSVSSAEATFNLWDDFDSANLSKWNAVTGSLSVSGGVATIQSDMIVSYNNWSNYMTIYEVKVGANAMDDSSGMQNPSSNGGTDTPDRTYLGNNCAGRSWFQANDGSGTSGGCPSGSVSAYDLYGIARVNLSAVSYYQNNVLFSTLTTNVPNDNLSLGMRDWGGGGWTADWVRVRGYNDSIIYYSFGAEQQNKGSIEVQFETPPTPVNYANISEENITIKVNATYTNSTFNNISYDFYNVNGTITTFFFENETYEINITLPTAHFHYNVTICGNESITDTDICDSTETRHLNHDIDPPFVNISAPSGTFDYLYEGKPIDLNWTILDEGEGLDSCWFIYNNITTFLNCSANYTTFNYSVDINNLTVYANDTFGNAESNFTSWDYKVLEVNKTYSNETLEGKLEDFILYLKKGSGINVQNVVLHYDGTEDTSSLFSSGNDVHADSMILIPSVSADINNSFYFTITLSDASVFNTSNATQLVRNVAVDDCSANPYLFLTLNLVDEGNQSSITGDIEVYLSILNPTNYQEVLNFNNSYSSVSSKTFCSNQLLNQSGFYLGAEIRYDSGNHSAEFYNIQRSDLSDYPKEYILYDLKDDDTTKFKILYRGENLLGVPGAIVQLQRKYISEGVFKIVEAPLTSSESTAVVHIDTNTNLYKATVVKDGVLLNTFDNLNFVCQSELTGECTLDLTDYIVPPNSVSIESIQDFSYSISSDIDNKTITLDYSVPSGTTSDIRVLAVQTDIIGEETICNTTVSSAGGSIECNYNDSIQDSYIDYIIYKDDSPIAQKSYIVQDDLRDDFQGDNYFILIIFTISLLFMALLSPEWIIINAIISIIVGGATWLLRGMDFVLGLGAIAWLLLGAIIIIIKMSKQEDQ